MSNSDLRICGGCKVTMPVALWKPTTEISSKNGKKCEKLQFRTSALRNEMFPSEEERIIYCVVTGAIGPEFTT